MLKVLVSNEGVEEPAVAVYLMGNALNRLNTDAEGAREFVEVRILPVPLCNGFTQPCRSVGGLSSEQHLD